MAEGETEIFKVLPSLGRCRDAPTGMESGPEYKFWGCPLRYD